MLSWLKDYVTIDWYLILVVEINHLLMLRSLALEKREIVIILPSDSILMQLAYFYTKSLINLKLLDGFNRKWDSFEKSLCL